ncbi:V-type ATP synthase subunit E [Paramaledivibacter caminithermalis]|jgi:vacuolar-type H+-ATPase subunit E/Vma4|uniref:ATP synthase E subunit n=1 Tax=Paramaledivibacter caminithermalis (strain DSM 15212 / CIP 107654 / DViRD3) TaxID=1121301 RepID=A0A1M6L1B2_PARC5|nr:V-type ATP synthase subunit E family protein [Paramaledivibacter caminithermalis]SHJ64926.1 ATP synthase E subunit [Paramaledivibacter caminithermalis DSM 15212]
MITVEEKLDVFTKLVLEKVQREYEEKKREIEEKNNKIIKEYRLEIDKKCHKTIENIVNRGKIEKNRLISKAKVEGKRIVLGKKEELLEKLIKNIEAKALQFTYEDDYKDYLKNNLYAILKNLENKNSIILFFTERDRRRYDRNITDILKEKGFDIEKVKLEELDSSLIGGVIGMDQEKTIKIDCCIKTQIYDNKELIGQMLYDELGK